MSNIAGVPREKLKEIIARTGDDLLQDPDRCEGLLKDHCGPHRKEISALVGALEERVPLELKSSWQSAMTPEAMRARLVQRLQDNRGLAPDVADWAVDTWSYALGVGLGRRSERLDSVISGGAPPPVIPSVAMPSTPQPHPADAAWAREFGDAEIPPVQVSQPQQQSLVTPAPVPVTGWSMPKKAGAAVAVAVIAYFAYTQMPKGASNQVQPCAGGQTRAASGECVSPPPAPDPKPPEPPKVTASIALGTSVGVSVGEDLNSDAVTMGQYVKGTTLAAILVDGKPVVPAGSAVILQVKGIDQAGKLLGAAKIDLALVEMSIGGTKYTVESANAVVKGPSKTVNTAKKVGIFGAIGTGIGCGVGKITKHTGAGCAAGAGGGAATGVALSAKDKPKPATLKAGAVLKFKLTQPVNIV